VRIPDGIVIEEWYRSPLVLAVRDDHPLASRRAAGIRDIKDYPLITYPKEAGIGLYWQVMNLCAKAGFRPHIAHEVFSLTTIVGLVNAGSGIAVVPADTQALALEGVKYLPLRDKDAKSSLFLAFRETDASKQVGSLLRCLRDAVR
jgi:DNA-binding transcriptional LysR family regulator